MNSIHTNKQFASAKAKQDLTLGLCFTGQRYAGDDKRRWNKSGQVGAVAQGEIELRENV